MEHIDLSKTMEDKNSTMSQSNIRPAPTTTGQQITHLLTTSLSPAVLQAFNDKLELLRKGSFYIKIIHGCHPQNSIVLQLINPEIFQRLKNTVNSHVKMRLVLLEELLKELIRGHEELQAITEQKGVKENVVQEKISWLLKMATDFEEVSAPRSLYLKHSLLPDVSRAWFPEVQPTLSFKTPVRFDRDFCIAIADSATLFWSVLEEDQQEPGEHFEIHYKLLHPTDKADGSESRTLTSTDYWVRVGNLLPGMFYEFKVKRVDCRFLVYSLWTDTMVLRTQEDGGQMGDECIQQSLN